MKKDKALLSLMIVAGVLLVSLVVYFGFLQSSIGTFTSLSTCQSQLKNYCGANVYSCADCKSYVDPVWGKLWSADCSMNIKAISPNVCLNPVNVVSQTGSGCFDNDLYWYNSIGVRESKKTECGTAGCSSPYGGGYESCNKAPTTQPSQPADVYPKFYGKMCFGNNLCLNAQKDRVDAPYACTPNNMAVPYLCQNGCNAGACLPPACKDECSSLGLTECTSKAGFRVCQTNNKNGCLVWSDDKLCMGEKVCDSGVCTEPSVAPPSPSNPPVQSTIPSNKGTNLCKDVSCPDYCDTEGTLHKGGTCSAVTNECVYGEVHIASPDCQEKVQQKVEEKGWLQKNAYYLMGSLVLIIAVLAVLMTRKKR